MPCRINKRRVWTHRIMLETTQHPVNSFWTLTYSDENIPLTETEGEPLATLRRRHLTDFIKRLRWHHQPEKLRYFNVGEYGDQTERPHYHLALFNFPSCARGITQVDRRGNCCPVCDAVKGIWGFGLVHAGQLETSSAAYIAGYCTKKLTKKDDPRLKGREAEFATMSKMRGGIGVTFMPEVASVLLSHNLDSTESDVPTSLRHGSSVLPLGRYLTRTLRVQTGMQPNAPQATIEKIQAPLQPLREVAKATAPKGLYSETLKSLILDANEGRYTNMMGREKLRPKKGSI